MRRGLTMDDLGTFAELRLLAVLATYRSDGNVLLSPVWHEWRDGGFNVVTGSGDIKARHLRRDPRASIVVYEHEPPYRGVEVRGRGQLVSEQAQEAVLRIAIRYLGESAGTAYAERAMDDVLIRIGPGELRAWDFSDELS